MRRRGLWGTLAVLFVVVPLLEIYLLVQVGQVIGAWWTLLILVADGLLGGYLIRREGGRAWRALTEALRSYRMPDRELADGALVLIGGTLLLTPGFFTDAVGLVLVLPVTRPVARRLLTTVVARKLTGAGRRGAGPGQTAGEGTRQRPGHDSVVRGEVID